MSAMWHSRILGSNPYFSGDLTYSNIHRQIKSTDVEVLLSLAPYKHIDNNYNNAIVIRFESFKTVPFSLQFCTEI